MYKTVEKTPLCVILLLIMVCWNSTSLAMHSDVIRESCNINDFVLHHLLHNITCMAPGFLK